MEFLWIVNIAVLVCVVQSSPCERQPQGCTPCDNKAEPGREGFSTICYTPSGEHLVNPSRGFTEIINARASDFSALTVSRLDNMRQQDGVTIVWRQYILDTFVSSDITQDFIDKVIEDLDVIRQARFTCIVRFMYTDVGKSEAPYGDATKAWMLTHIEQLSTVFVAGEDVIDSIQAGFIGIWGEWYYTTYFGDPNHLDWSSPDNIRGLTPAQWADRRDVLLALLNAVPKTLQVQVRLPPYKQVPVDDWTPTTKQEMEQRTDKARIGHHNDCFVSSSTDVGTYVNKSVEYPYIAADTQYTVSGGETCRVCADPPDRSHCPTALKELTELHYSYLNQKYSLAVLQIWKDQGCYNNVHRDLGYRFVLVQSTMPDTVRQDGQFCFTITLRNDGYAAPYKPKDVILVLRSAGGSELYGVSIEDTDVRLWYSQTNITIEGRAYIPQVTSGVYDILFAVREPGLADVSDYYILFANEGVPELQTGFNSLQHSVEVLAGSDGSGDPVCPHFETLTPPTPTKYDRLYCGLGGCPPSEGCAKYAVINHSFETEDEGWQGHMDGFSYSADTASHGVQSAKVQNGGPRQVFKFNLGVRSFQVKADSYNEDVVGGNPNDYSIYCDGKFMDGVWSYGHAEPFTVGYGDWETKTLVVNTPQDIDEGWCYGMFRNHPVGVAYFDNFHVWTSGTDIEDCEAS